MCQVERIEVNFSVIYSSFFFRKANFTETRLGDNLLSKFKVKLP